MYLIRKVRPILSRFWRHFMHDTLYRNSLLLMLSTAVMAAFGFAFWAVCARLYTPSEVGLAAALISATALLTNISFLGLPNTLIRYIPRATDKSAYVGTAIVISSVAAVVASAIFLAGLNIFAPHIATTNPSLLAQ